MTGSYQKGKFITTRIRRMREGNILRGRGGTLSQVWEGGAPSLVQMGGGGYPIPGLDGGEVSHPRSGGGYPVPGLDGGYPIPGLHGGYPILLTGGTPSHFWMGVPPHPSRLDGYPPVQVWRGYPVPGLDGVPPPPPSSGDRSA